MGEYLFGMLTIIVEFFVVENKLEIQISKPETNSNSAMFQ